jgi:SEC-C motif-containing protein
MFIKNKCFCGTNKTFLTCCHQFIDEQQIQRLLPKTPEQLMRSRFSAYATNNSQYIYDTYAKSSQALQSLQEIDDWSKSCKWIALQIHSSTHVENLSERSQEQFVEFSAFYITDDTLWELREHSRFVLEKPSATKMEIDNNHLYQWRYIDGDIITNCEIIHLKRKDLCPCNNYSTAWSGKKGKKFKQCCGK